MSTSLRELYQEVILDHNKNPRNRRRIEHPTGTAQAYNPLCGDQVTIYVDVQDDIVREVTFEGQGCAISTASASMLTEAITGRSVEEANNLFNRFHRLVVEGITLDESDPDSELLSVLGGVKEFPARIKCATLPWHALASALDDGSPVITEGNDA